MLRKFGWKTALIVTVLVGVALVAGSVPALASTAASNPATYPAPGICRTGRTLADIVCDVLGISQQDLIQERQAGKSLLDIAEAKNVDKDQLVKAVMEKRQEQLDQALQDKKITREQYDQCLQTMQQRLEKNLARQPGRNGKGQGIGNGLCFGNGQGNGGGRGCRANCWW